MLKYGKTSQNAIAAVSFLAAHYSSQKDAPLFSSKEVAKARGLSQPLAAKIFTQLSQAGFLISTRGPNGGYRLISPPASITLYDICKVFERIDDELQCPFGPGWCGNREPCPLHDRLKALSDDFDHYLRNTNFSVFEVDNPDSSGWQI